VEGRSSLEPVWTIVDEASQENVAVDKLVEGLMNDTKSETGRVYLIRGKAGVGKSAMACYVSCEFLRRSGDEGEGLQVLAAYRGFRPNALNERRTVVFLDDLNLENVNVVYDLSQNGRPVYTIEVSLNPSATIILNITKYPAVFSGVSYSINWSGYEYYNSGGIIQSGASWAEPSAAIPSGQCQWAHCDYVFWVGETHAAGGGLGGSAYIAQTGTDSGVACTFWCTYYYYDWYDFYPGYAVTCNNIGVGDSVTASVWNSYQPSVGGYQYSVSTQDNTSHQLCYSQSTATFYMGVSYYTQYMGETPADSNTRGYATLPVFSTLSMYGGYYYDSSYNSHTIGSGWSTESEMALSSTSTRCNGVNGYWNICNSAVSSGSFTETYLTSSGT
jgi:hypothetical protein